MRAKGGLGAWIRRLGEQGRLLLRVRQRFNTEDTENGKDEHTEIWSAKHDAADYGRIGSSRSPLFPAGDPVLELRLFMLQFARFDGPAHRAALPSHGSK
jgi:hypothetical protein